MLEKLKNKLTGPDELIRAMHQPDDNKFAEVFARSTVLFLQVPPGYENGIDPNISQEEFLAHVRAGAQDISQREQFTPFRRVCDGRKALLLFTRQDLATEFAKAYVRQIKRIMPFGALGVKGKIALRLFNGVDSVVFNALTKYEYELSAERLALLSQNLHSMAEGSE
jgi:hypothetical protein